MKTTLLILCMISSFYNLAQPAGYNFGKQLLVNSSQVSGATNLSNFVMLVNFTDPDLRTTANSGNVENNNGFDIVFTLGNCNTLLDHQIEKYVPATGEFIAWVKIPTLYAAINTNIHMYYGNSSISTDPSTTAVWGAEYGAVWHLNQSPAGASPQVIDYTSNTNDGAANGGMVAADLVAGQIGDGIDFDGSNDFLDCGADASVDPIGSITVSSWLYSRAASGHVINRGGGWDDNGYSLFYYFDNIRIELQRTGEKDVFDNVISINTWHYVALTYDSGTGTIRCFIDGVQQGNTGNHTGPIGLPVENLNVGRKEQNNFYFNGIIDEGRVIHALRSNDWIATEYANQNSPSTFYAVSAEMSANMLCVVLPIELIEFNAIPDEQVVFLEWRTASELNNDYFTIERSMDGIEWQKVSQINGAGNSTNVLTYSSIDTRPFIGTSYYRLKQTDFDGQFEYSQLKSVNFTGKRNLKIFPNPTENHIKIIGSRSEIAEINIYTTLGKNVTPLTSINKINEQQKTLDLSQLNSGIYFVKTKTATTKIIKK